MKVLICDDNPYDAKILSDLLDEYGGFETEIFTDSEAAMQSEGCYDFAFIDIEMPKLNGLALTRKLKERSLNLTVFIVTSFNRYLDDAMDLNVFRYLSKPVSRERLFKGLDTAIRLFRQNRESIVAETSDGCHTVSLNDILYLTIERRRAKFVTVQGELISTQGLEHWKSRLLDDMRFTQPHYSFIVNLANVTDFTRTEITLSKGGKTAVVPISRGHYQTFRKAFFDYMGVTL